jgi:hypothetical protein
MRDASLKNVATTTTPQGEGEPYIGRGRHVVARATSIGASDDLASFRTAVTKAGEACGSAVIGAAAAPRNT